MDNEAISTNVVNENGEQSKGNEVKVSKIIKEMAELVLFATVVGAVLGFVFRPADLYSTWMTTALATVVLAVSCILNSDSKKVERNRLSSKENILGTAALAIMMTACSFSQAAVASAMRKQPISQMLADSNQSMINSIQNDVNALKIAVDYFQGRVNRLQAEHDREQAELKAQEVTKE